MKTIALLLVLGLALAFSVQCPIHDLSSYWTGTSKFIDGKQLKQYRCPRGHTFWIVG